MPSKFSPKRLTNRKNSSEQEVEREEPQKVKCVEMHPRNVGLPLRLRINGKPWTVDNYSNVPFEFSKFGACNSANLSIVINRDTHPHQQVDTLLHEVIHVLSDDGKLELTENQVHALASALHGFMVDNPTFAMLYPQLAEAMQR